MNDINCLMVSSGPLSAELQTSLYFAAVDMMRRDKLKMRLTMGMHGVRGWLTTDGKETILVTIKGCIFDAQVFSNGRSIDARFIVTMPVENPDQEVVSIRVVLSFDPQPSEEPNPALN